MRKSLLLLSAAFLPFFSQHAAADAPKWQGHIEAEGKWGNDRSLGEAGLFAPIWQDEDTLVFTDIRGRIDNQGSSEGNFGIGMRQMMDQGWIIGGYSFYDRRRTDNDNTFNQMTLGIEAMSENYEARVNGYIPESNEKDAGTGSSVGAISGGQFQIRNMAAPQERALPGFDAEIGAGFDIGNDWKLWAYGGGFYFNADDYQEVSGPRGRLEISREDLPFLGQDSRLTLGVESQTDDVRGGQTFAIARLRVPFSSFSKNTNKPALSPLQKRMTDRIYRDVDIVSGEQASQLASVESAEYTLPGGAKVTSFTTVDATGNISAVVAGAGANSLVVADGSAGTINTAARVSMFDGGQMLIGGGSSVTVTGSSSGTTATLTLPGTRPTINGTNGGVDVFGVGLGNNDYLLQNINVTGGKAGVTLNNGDNIVLRDLAVTDTGDDNIWIVGADNITIDSVTMARAAGGAEEAIQFDAGTNTVTITDSTFSNVNAVAIFTAIPGGSTYSNVSFTNVTSDATTNVITVQGGETLANPSGAITATNIGGVACSNAGTINASTLTINGVTCN